MALAAVKTWGNEILTASDLNAEFANIRNNALSLISPLTGNLAAGGFILTGLGLGSVSTPAIGFTGDANTGVCSTGPDTVVLVAGGVGFASFSASNQTLTRISASTDGPELHFFHDSSSPADSDAPMIIRSLAKDDGGTSRTIMQMHTVFEDVTSTTMDSQIAFTVMSNVNAGNAATTASLSSLGVWTDASAARQKEYIGDLTDVITKAKQLTTLGIYRGKDMPVEKQATAELHFSPTAEEVYEVFGLGIHPSKTTNPGIAPKDLACIAIKMALELDERLAKLGG